MRKENEIYCSNCGTLISLEARFCTTCGFNQVEFPLISNTTEKLINEEPNLNILDTVLENKIESENNKVVVEDKSTKVIGFLFFFILAVAIWYLMSTISPSSTNNSKTTEPSSYRPSPSIKCPNCGSTSFHYHETVRDLKVCNSCRMGF